MSCMHCIVYALHSLAWRPASLSVRAFATSVFLLYGCCPGKQWPIDWTRNSQDNMNMLQHASSCFRHFAPRQQSGASGHLYITIYTAGSEHPCIAKKTLQNWSIIYIYAPLTVLTIDCKPRGAGIASIKNAERLQRQHPTEPFFPPSSSMWNPIQSLENSVKGLHSHPFWVTCKETKEHAQLEPLSLNSHLSHLIVICNLQVSAPQECLSLCFLVNVAFCWLWQRRAE